MLYDFVSKRYLFFGISLLIIIPGLLALIIWGVKPSIDFTGGTVWEVVPTSGSTTENFISTLEGADLSPNPNLDNVLAQTAQFSNNGVTTDTMVLRMRDLSETERQKLTAVMVNQGLVAGTTVTDTVANQITPSATVTATTTTTSTAGTATGTTTTTRTEFAPGMQVQFNTVGPAIGAEVQEKAFIAVLVASLGIMGYLWFAFRRVPNALRYGVCAVAALLHDALVVLGIFAILGELFGFEVDSLFITAMLTVIGFSVHDTIVVFDRIRENMLRRRFDTFEKVVNYSLVQTLARSINTSLTVLFTLLALFLFGGTSIHGFVLALLIGIASGTYSSIFNASLLLVVWENKEWRNWFGRGGSSNNDTRVRTTA